MRPFEVLRCGNYQRQVAGTYLVGTVPPAHIHTIGPL